jgi:cytochrome c553
MSRRFLVILAASLACTLSYGEVTEADSKKAEGSCAGCHGPQGAKPVLPQAPKLAGQQYGYLVESLKALRSGARESPMMGAIAKPLSDRDIRTFAEYYSAQPGLQTKY